MILSIFTAFVIEAFLLEYESHSKITNDTKLEKRIIDLGYNYEITKSKKYDRNLNVKSNFLYSTKF